MENKSTFAKFIDNSFYCSSIIFFSILWCGYLTNNLTFQVLLGIIFGSILYFIIYKLIKKTKTPKSLLKSEKKHKRECMATLQIANPTKIFHFFKVMLEPRYTVQIKKPFIVATDETNTNTFLIYFNFLAKQFSTEMLYNLLENIGKQNKKLLIFAISFSTDTIIATKNLENIYLLDENESYLFFKEFNTFPKISQKVKEKRFSNLKNNLFSSINSKKFIKISIFFALFSIFSPLKKYYLVSSTILLIFAVICFFLKPKANQSPSALEFLSNSGK